MADVDRVAGNRRAGSRLAAVLGLAALLFGSACASVEPTRAGEGAPSRFEPHRDTFAFPNLVRAERPGWNHGFANYCIVMSRAAGQFFRFARFDPASAPVTAEDYTRLTRAILDRPLWGSPVAAAERVVVPGYRDLHAFSAAQEAAIKAAFGWHVWSMAHWRTWRVALALSGGHQAGVARELVAEVDAGRPAPIMITNFPHEDLLNHAVLVYDYRRPRNADGRVTTIEFLAYDPNDPGSPLAIRFDAAARQFLVAPLPYAPAGPVRAFRLYTSPLL
jgi:hypothetical protein